MSTNDICETYKVHKLTICRIRNNRLRNLIFVQPLPFTYWVIHFSSDVTILFKEGFIWFRERSELVTVNLDNLLLSLNLWSSYLPYFNFFPRSLRWDSIVVYEVWSVSAIFLDDRKGFEETMSDKESYIWWFASTIFLVFKAFVSIHEPLEPYSYAYSILTINRTYIFCDIDRTFTFLKCK